MALTPQQQALAALKKTKLYKLVLKSLVHYEKSMSTIAPTTAAMYQEETAIKFTKKIAKEFGLDID